MMISTILAIVLNKAVTLFTFIKTLPSISASKRYDFSAVIEENLATF
jgi:hypothetical protein